VNKATFQIMVTYQTRENYGAHCWDGKGECPQYWKYKGGVEYIIADGLTSEQVSNKGLVDWIVQQMAPQHECCNDYFEVYFLDFDVQPSGTLNWLDQQEMKYMDPAFALALGLEVDPEDAVEPRESWEKYTDMAESYKGRGL